MGAWFAVAVVVGVASVLGFRALSKRSFVKQRTVSSLEELHASVKEQVSFDVFSEVWAVIGKAYGINPGLIRPGDTFDELGKADSWVLGKGEDDLTKWLDNKGLGRPTQLPTVLDLAIWVQSSLSANAAR
jgi:hypothetical protein